MSKSSEQSYYEVALTSRQVAAGFVILLACLVAAFFSGVWVGRSGQARADQVAAVSPAGGGEAEEQNPGVPDLEFFAGEDRPEGGGAAPEETAGSPPDASPRPGTTLAEDLQARREPAREISPPGSGSGGAAGGEEQPIAKWKQERRAAGEAARRESDEPPAAKPVIPAAPRPARSVPAEPAPAKPAPGAASESAAAGAEVFVIQVVSSRDQAKARQILSWLRDGGYPASLSTTEQGEVLMYRVRVGPYGDRPAAERVADEVRRKFKLDTWITSE